MDDLILNLDFAAPERRQKKEPGSQKHRSFVRRRRELERRGVLRHKQLPPAAPGRPRRARARRSGAKPPKENGAAAAQCPPVPQNRTGSVGKARGAAGSAPLVPQNPARSKEKVQGAAGSAPVVPQNPARSKEKVQGAAGSAPVVPQNPTRSKEKVQGAAGSAPLVPQNGSGAPAAGKARGTAGSAPPAPHKLVAMDCEMVGTGPGGRCSALARCSVVSYEGDVLYDRFVRPEEPVVDYRTRWSGVRPRHMATAAPFRAARQQVLKILAGKVVVGHAIHNDFKALHYCHPKALTRDTSQIPLLNRRAGFPENVAISLKRLTKALLNQDIQVGKGGHSSVEDARATMELYKVVEEEWEQHLQQNPEQK